MKRMVIGMLVACLMVFAVGTAYAQVDTNNFVVPPSEEDKQDIENALGDGGTVGDIVDGRNIDGYLQDLVVDQGLPIEIKNEIVNALNKYLEEQQDAEHKSMPLLIPVLLRPGVTQLPYEWANGEALYSFIEGKFFLNNNGTVESDSISVQAAPGTIEIDLLGDDFEFFLVNDDFTEGMFLSVKDKGVRQLPGGSSGGCATFPVAAFALFFLPALALVVKRGQK